MLEDKAQVIRGALALSSSSHSNDQLFGAASGTLAGGAIERSNVQASFAIDRLFKAWHFWALALLICGGVGVLSIASGRITTGTSATIIYTRPGHICTIDISMMLVLRKSRAFSILRRT